MFGASGDALPAGNTSVVSINFDIFGLFGHFKIISGYSVAILRNFLVQQFDY